MVSMPHSSLPRRMRKKPSSPQSGVPTVCDNPIFGEFPMALRAPADDLHGMTSLLWFMRVPMVDTAPVQHETAINHKAHLDRTILHEVLLHVSCAVDGVSMICLGPDEPLRIDTFRRTLLYNMKLR